LKERLKLLGVVGGPRFFTSTRVNDALLVDIRATNLHLITDLMTSARRRKQLPNKQGRRNLDWDLTRRIKQVLGDYKEIGACEGIGVVVPGMVDGCRTRASRRPFWRDVNLREPLAATVGIPVHIENRAKLVRGSALGHKK
jgi:predicted NBD/HSP70 family sugar kinase